MGRVTLHWDCLSGVSGDMVVGALRDLGVPETVFESAVASLALDGLGIRFGRESRMGIEGTRFEVLVGGHPVEEAGQAAPDQGHDHEHGHGQGHGHEHGQGHGHGHGRTFRAIREILGHSGLGTDVRERAVRVFERIAVAEGRIHGLPAEEVHFHEVGGEDAIVDIVCACAGVSHLGVDSVTASTIFDGSGWIHCAHGRFPLPAPATLEILKGVPIRQIDEPYEFVTPTGAALLAEFAENFGPMPGLRPLATGYGVGSRDLPTRPNVLRMVLGEADARDAAGLERDQVELIEANLDDCSPEVVADCMRRLLNAGALDAWTTPVTMKKGRPGMVLAALSPPELSGRLVRTLLEHTSSFGARIQTVDRLKFRREIRTVQTPHGPVRLKAALQDGRTVKLVPEFEDCRAIADKTGRPVRDIMRQAVALAGDADPAD